MSSLRHLPVPELDSGPCEGDLRVGKRVWWYRLGEWVDACIVARCRGDIQIRLVGSEHIMHVAGTHCFRLEQPMDCGRMIPPTGEAGIAHWMRVDPTVFWGREALWQHLMRRPL